MSWTVLISTAVREGDVEEGFAIVLTTSRNLQFKLVSLFLAPSSASLITLPSINLQQSACLTVVLAIVGETWKTIVLQNYVTYVVWPR